MFSIGRPKVCRKVVRSQPLTAFIRNLKKSALDSSREIAKKNANVFWSNARIPIRDVQHVVSKIEKLHDVSIRLKNNAKGGAEAQHRNEQTLL